MVSAKVFLSFALLAQLGLAGPLKRSFDVTEDTVNSPVKRYKALSATFTTHMLGRRGGYATAISPDAAEVSNSNLSGDGALGAEESPNAEGGLTEGKAAPEEATLPKDGTGSAGGTEDGKVPAVGVGSGNTSLLDLLSSTLAATPTATDAAVSPALSTTSAADSIALSEEATPPAEQATPPTGEAVPPSENATPAASDAAVPSAEATSVVNETVSPSETVTPAAGEATPPSTEATPASGEAAPPSEEAAPAASEAVPPSENATPAASDSAVPSAETTPAVNETVPPSRDATAAVSDAAAPSAEATPAASEAIPPSGDAIAAVSDAAVPSAEATPAAEAISPPTEVTPAAGEAAPPPENATAAVSDAAAPSAQVTPAVGETVSPSVETTPVASEAAASPTEGKEDGKVPAVGVGAGNTSLLDVLTLVVESSAQPATSAANAEQTTPVAGEDPLSQSPSSISTSCTAEMSDVAAPDATNVVPVALANNTDPTSAAAAIAPSQSPAQPVNSTDGAAQEPGTGEVSGDAANLAKDSVSSSGPEIIPQPSPAAEALPTVEEAPNANISGAQAAASSIPAGDTMILNMGMAPTTATANSEASVPETLIAAATGVPEENVAGASDTIVTVETSATMTTTVPNAQELAAASETDPTGVVPESISSTTVTPLGDPQNSATATSSTEPTPTPPVAIQTPGGTSEAVPPAESPPPAAGAPAPAQEPPTPADTVPAQAGEISAMTIPVGDFTIVVNAAPAPTPAGTAVIPVDGSCPTVTVTTTVTAA